MKTFKDAEGREWTLSVNVDAVRRVRSLVAVDLLKAADGDLLRELADDPIKLADVLWAVVQPQAQARNITDEQFGQALAGEVIDRATAALLSEIVDFFPAHRRGPMQAARAKLDTALEKAAAVAMEQINDIDIDDLLTSGDS